MIMYDKRTDMRFITGSVILVCSRYLLENVNEPEVKCLTVERAHAVRGRRLLQGLLHLLPPLGFILQSFLEFPLRLLLFLQTLLNDCWNGSTQRGSDEWDRNPFIKPLTETPNHLKLNIWWRIKASLYKIKQRLRLNKLLRGIPANWNIYWDYFFSTDFSH